MSKVKNAPRFKANLRTKKLRIQYVHGNKPFHSPKNNSGQKNG